jgi:hypothetical protein
MNPKTAVTMLYQGEKIKSGIIWANELIQSAAVLSPSEKPGAEKAVSTLIRMIGFESVLARRATRDEVWTHLEKDLDMALVMIDSGVFHEASFHLNKALRQAAGISQKGMTFLMDQGLL